jgi:hypothetical protein
MIRISPHLIRAPIESPDRDIEGFYEHLLAILRKLPLKNGVWQRLDPQQAWDGNGSWDSFIAHSWLGTGGERMLIAVNYSPYPGQCYLRLHFPEINNCSVRLRDALGPAVYIRDGNELLEHGLYLDMQPWACHVFEVEDNQ